MKMRVFICGLFLPGLLLALDSHPIEVTEDKPSRIEKRSANGYIRPCYVVNLSSHRPGRGKFLPKEYTPGLCTHILFAHAWISEEFKVRVTDLQDLDFEGTAGLYRQVNELKNTDPQLKTLLSIGGYEFGTVLFKKMSKDAAARQIFIESAIAFVREHGFDGIDIDWEFPWTEDKENYSKLIRELRQAVEEESLQTNKERLLLTAPVAPGETTVAEGYNVQQLAKHLDFVMLMAFDFHGAWEPVTGLNAPLYARDQELSFQKIWNMDWAANNWYEKGMSKEKIVVGMATYGRGWTLRDATVNDIGVGSADAIASKPTPFKNQKGEATYYELCEMLAAGATRVWDEQSQTPYLYLGDQWFSYDDQQSFRAKMAWLKEKRYGGAFVWSLDMDDFNGECSNGNGKKYPLISIIAEELANSKPQPKFAPITTTTTTRRPTTTTKPDTENKPFACHGYGFHPDPTSCSHFYRCAASVPHRFACPGGLHFSKDTNVCIYPRDANCSV